MKDKKLYLELLEKSLSFFPLTQRNLIISLQTLIEEKDTVLDVGCGLKHITKHIVCEKLVGIDIDENYLVKDDIHGDVVELEKYFQPETFDIIIAIDLIEHLEKKDGFKLLDDCDKIARRKIFMMTPYKWSENTEAVINPIFWTYGNEYNYHKSLWTPDEFTDKGYTIIPADFEGEFFLAMKDLEKK